MTWVSKSNLLLVSAFLFLAYPKATISQARQIDPEKQRQIDEYIQNTYLPGSGISTLGLSIVQNDGELLYTTGYGKSDIERDIDAGNQTQFLIASVTKSVTSVVAAKLLNELFPNLGEAVLDTPIRQLVPHFNFTLIDRFRSEHITVRDLLSHRVCVFNPLVVITAAPFPKSQEAVYQQRYNEEICGVRTEFQYNNLMYAYAGELIALLAGKPFEDAVEDFLKELDMMNSAFTRYSDDFSQMPNRAKPYYVLEGVPHPMNTELVKRIVPANAGGGLFTTPNDMSKYMRFHLNLGSLNGRQIVPQEVMKWLTKPSNMLSPRFIVHKQSDNDKIINQFAYGLGFFISTYDGWEYNMHDGDFPPYHSLFSLYPTQKLSIYSSVNMAPYGIDRKLLHATIFEILQGTENITEKMEKLAKQISQQKEEENIKLQNESEIFLQEIEEKAKLGAGAQMPYIGGIYGSGSLGEITVTLKQNPHNNQLQFYMSYGRWYSGWLDDGYAGIIYKLRFDTDAVQDDYVIGYDEAIVYVIVMDDSLRLVKIQDQQRVIHLGDYKLGLRLDQLPAIPWAPDSC